jgi:hypothetical protein
MLSNRAAAALAAVPEAVVQVAALAEVTPVAAVLAAVTPVAAALAEVITNIEARHLLCAAYQQRRRLSNSDTVVQAVLSAPMPK